MKKAQSSLEALVVLGVLFLLFFGIYGFYRMQNNAVDREKQILLEKFDCYKLSEAITEVFIHSGNVSKTVSVSHPLTIVPSEQRILTKNTFCTFRIPGELILTNSSVNGIISITKENNVILFN